MMLSELQALPEVQALVQVSDGLIVGYGYFPAGAGDPGLEVRDVAPEELAKLTEPGEKHMAADGTITVTPPPPPPYSFAAGEDAERMALINERAATDPAYAALADFVLRGVSR